MRGKGEYNDVRFLATATGAASRERREETAREEEGQNSESAACSKCGDVCLSVCIFNKSKSIKSASANEQRVKFRRTAQSYKPANADGLNPIVSLSKPEELKTSKFSVLINVFYTG